MRLLFGSSVRERDGMDRNRVLLIGGALVLALFLAYMFAGGGIVPR